MNSVKRISTSGHCTIGLVIFPFAVVYFADIYKGLAVADNCVAFIVSTSFSVMKPQSIA